MSFWAVPDELDPRLWRVLGGVFVSTFGVGLTLPYLLVYLHEVRGIGLSAAAVILAWMSLVALAITPVGGRLIDRTGPWGVLMGALAIAGLGSLALAVSTTMLLALMATAVTTSGWTLAAAAESTMLSRLAGDAAKEWVFGGQYMVSSIAIGLGAMVSGFVIDTSNPTTFTAIYIIDGLSYFAYIAVVATMPGVGSASTSEDGDGGVPEARFRDALGDRTFRRLLGIYTIFFVCTAGQIESGFPAFATQVADVEPAMLGFAFLGNTLLVAGGQFLLIPRLIGRGRTRLLVLCGLIWAVSWGIVGLSGIAPSEVVATTAVISGLLVFAFGEIVAAPIAPALVNDLAPEHLRGSYNAAYGLTFSLGATAGPLVTAVTIGTGHPWLWVMLVCLGCLAGSVLIALLGRTLTPQQQGVRASG